ncbi:MAG: galactokinase [Oscillospiraceae bacterium]|nr:galactokinase [Oscillospiraceae bacterium]
MNERFFSAPGRVEIGGNHTDHQHGRVLAAAINLEIKCSAVPNGTNTINLENKQYGSQSIDLENLDVRKDEINTASALVRGVAAWFNTRGYKTGGFDAVISSDIPLGSGLSSSAAFEVMLGNIFKGLFGSDITPLEIAIAGKYAENVYFGKPSGLMDQAASSFGGLNMIDFYDPDCTVVTPVKADLSGYELCVVTTGGDHADLTPEYASIPEEMKKVAGFFGKDFLSEITIEEFYSELHKMQDLSKRAILRSLHFFEDHERVLKQAAALESGNIQAFLDLVTESGRSSLAYLQNVFSPSDSHNQELTLALALSEKILAGKGAWRVHGGGFAGTILAFVPDELKDSYKKQLSAVFGDNCCLFLNIRNEGGMEVT